MAFLSLNFNNINLHTKQQLPNNFMNEKGKKKVIW